jgi:hypothetical protein
MSQKLLQEEVFGGKCPIVQCQAKTASYVLSFDKDIWVNTGKRVETEHFTFISFDLDDGSSILL